MPSKINQELVRAFNIILCENDIGITNFTVHSTDQTFFKKEDRIVISFDKNMDVGQCMEYLHNIKKSIVETFCGSESGANMSFNIKFFPFNFNKEQLIKDSKERYKFLVPMDKDVIFNLKCLLAHGFAKDTKEDMGNEFGERCMEGCVYDVSFDRKSYLYCMQFYDKRLQDYFVKSFSSRVKDYKNSPKKTGDFLKIKDNCVYIKASIFDNVEFIREVVKRKASLICRDFQVPSSEDEVVESLKFPVINLLYEIGIPVDFIFHTSYTGSGENSVLVPIIQITSGIEGKENCRLLNKEEVSYVNRAFGMGVLRNVQDYTSPKHLPVFGNGGVYGIDFYDKDISYCVLNKIMESSVINKDHELAIDPELHFRALSPVLPGTPPNQRNRDSGIGVSPLTKDSGSSSGGPGPSSKISHSQVSPPRQGSILRHDVGAAEVGAAANMPAWTSASFQPIGFWSSPTPSAEPSLWQPSRPLSRKGANESGSAGTSQPIGFWSSPTPSAEPSLWQPSRPSSWKGANESGSAWTSACSSSAPSAGFSPSGPSLWGGAVQNVQVGPSTWTQPMKSGEDPSAASVPVDNKRPQSLPLTENTPKPSSESPKKIIQQFFRNLSIRRSKSNGKATKDILQFDKETFSSFSSGMQKVLSLPLSLDMIRNLFPHFPIGKREKLILLACSEKVKKSHSSPEEIEQLLSSLLPEEQEICSLLFFPDRKNETYVDLSPGAKKQVVLFWEVLRGRGFNSTSSEESGIFSGSSSQGSTSDEDKLEARGESLQSGRSSVSSNSSTSTVRTKVDSPKTEKHSQEEKGVLV